MSDRVTIDTTLPAGTPLRIAYDGLVDQPHDYKVGEGGSVLVESEYAARFLRAVVGSRPGSKPAERAVAQAQTSTAPGPTIGTPPPAA